MSMGTLSLTCTQYGNMKVVPCNYIRLSSYTAGGIQYGQTFIS